MAQKPMLRGEVGAQRTRTHFTPQHWLLCHMGMYQFEFEFALALRVRSVSREEAWASAVVQGAWMIECGCEAG